MHHWWFSTFSGQCIHIARAYRKSGPFFCLTADTLHICAKKCIHTSNTDHHDRWFLIQTITDFFHCLWDFLQMTTCHNICLVHHQIKKSIVIFTHGTDQGCISSAASRCHDQHDRIRNGEPGSLYPESFCSWRIKGKCCRGAVDQMHIGFKLIRNVISSTLI